METELLVCIYCVIMDLSSADLCTERRGALQDAEERVDQLLPKDYLEKRQKGERNAKLAINVRLLATRFFQHETNLSHADQRHCQHLPARSEDCCCFLFWFPFSSCLSRRLCSGSAMYAHCLDYEQAGVLASVESEETIPRRYNPSMDSHRADA